MRRPYPWKCSTCRERAMAPVTVDYQTEMEHDGRVYNVSVPQLQILECGNCHSRMLPDEANAKLIDALRVKADLLTPVQIREKRKALGLTQQQLAACLRV